MTAVRWISKNWHLFATTLGGIALAVVGVPSLFAEQTSSNAPTAIGGHAVHVESYLSWPWGWPEWLFLAGVIMLIVGLCRQLTISPTYVQLLRERDDANAAARKRAAALEALLRGMLTELSVALRLNTPTTRASIYCHIDSRFVLLSRFSDNPDFKKRGRSSYPEDEGVIGRAWREKQAVLQDLPADRDDWNAQLSESLSPEVLPQLRMHSRSLVALRIDASVPPESIPIGVIVLESTASRGVSASTMDKLLTDPHWATLQNAMANVRDHFPDVANTLVGERTTVKESWLSRRKRMKVEKVRGSLGRAA